MSTKIETSIEEIDSWVTDELVYDVLKNFGYIDEPEYREISRSSSSVSLVKKDEQTTDSRYKQDFESFNFTFEKNYPNIDLKKVNFEAA